MLVKTHSETFASLIEGLPNKIRLTSEMAEKLQTRGVASSNPFENRAAARHRCHGFAAIDLVSSHPALSRNAETALAIIRDLSRTGIGLVTHQQWYPTEMVRIQLLNSIILGEVARARRCGRHCYELGLRIKQLDAAN